MPVDWIKRNCQTISLKYFFAANAIYYVTMATVIFSLVKITLIFTCEDIMFSRESSPGILLVFVYSNYSPKPGGGFWLLFTEPRSGELNTHH